MNDIDDFDEEQSPEEAREILDHDLRTVGARAAYKALLEVCQDPKAPAPARATSGTALLRAAGYFNRENDRDGEKPIHALTFDEIERRIQKLDRQRRASERKPRDVFD
jgi:hypothetical protein